MNLIQALKKALYQNWQSVGETQYAIEENGNEVLIAFQGSMDWIDWLLNFYVIPYKDMEQPFYVHGGFLRQYKNVRDIVLDACKKAEKVSLVGHSLGGALCILAHEDLRFHYRNLTIHTYTFGAPRVLAEKSGCDVFILRLVYGGGTNLTKLINVVNGNDIVPQLPFWYMKNIATKHIGEPEKWWKFSIKQHMPDSYFKSLEK